MSSRQWRVVAVSVGLLVAVGVVGLFVVDAESTDPEPAEFDDTVSVGLTLVDEYELEEDARLPRAQVFYAQYEYVVGYYGVDRFVETQRSPGHTERFGYPVTIYVTDYSSVDLELSADGYPLADADPSWHDADDAWYVHGSEAAAPGGETVLPFSDRSDAEAFADDHGGTVLSWDELLETEFDLDDGTVARDRVDELHDLADERGDAADDLRERPVSTVVGEDADTIQAAVDDAPANTTVVVPEGEYEERVEIDRPLTLAGDGNVTVDGGGNGTVITSTAERTAIVGLDIVGSGDEQRPDRELPGDDDADDGDWGADFEENFAGGDAGVALHTAPGSLVEDVTVDSEVTGVIVRRSDDAVVRNVTVESPDDWRDGHAGILLFRSSAVAEESTVRDGSNGIYTHRAPDVVIRDNVLERNRIGIHLMHTSDALVADNELESQDNAGIYVMTGPERNAVVGNDVRDTDLGLSLGGSDSYVAGNVLADNDVGLQFDTATSRYEHNLLADNDLGMEPRAMLPTNQVRANDFVDNERHADTTRGPLRIWTHEGAGNYWQGVTAYDGTESVDRPYAPTDPVDQRLHRVDGAPTLAQAPAHEAITGLQGTVPGMRSGSIVDLSPTCEPTNPDLLEGTDWEDRAWSCHSPTTDHDNP